MTNFETGICVGMLLSKRGGANISPITITENGTYTAPSGTDGYNPINVAVKPKVGTKTITANGTYYASNDNLDGYDVVIVNNPYETLWKQEHGIGGEQLTLPDGTVVENAYPVENTNDTFFMAFGACPQNYITSDGKVQVNIQVMQGQDYHGHSTTYPYVTVTNLENGMSDSLGWNFFSEFYKQDYGWRLTSIQINSNHTIYVNFVVPVLYWDGNIKEFNYGNSFNSNNKIGLTSVSTKFYLTGETSVV